MLVSDVLHNSSAPVKNASAYRTKFEVALPDIMESFNDLYCSITGRITAEALKVFNNSIIMCFLNFFYYFVLAIMQNVNSTGKSLEGFASMVRLVSFL